MEKVNNSTKKATKSEQTENGGLNKSKNFLSNKNASLLNA